MSVNLEKMPECSVGLIGGVIKEWGGGFSLFYIFGNLRRSKV